jgi:hypothetical protein
LRAARLAWVSGERGRGAFAVDVAAVGVVVVLGDGLLAVGRAGGGIAVVLFVSTYLYAVLVWLEVIVVRSSLRRNVTLCGWLHVILCSLSQLGCMLELERNGFACDRRAAAKQDSHTVFTDN